MVSQRTFPFKEKQVPDHPGWYIYSISKNTRIINLATNCRNFKWEHCQLHQHPINISFLAKSYLFTLPRHSPISYRVSRNSWSKIKLDHSEMQNKMFPHRCPSASIRALCVVHSRSFQFQPDCFQNQLQKKKRHFRFLTIISIRLIETRYIYTKITENPRYL